MTRSLIFLLMYSLKHICGDYKYVLTTNRAKLHFVNRLIDESIMFTMFIPKITGYNTSLISISCPSKSLITLYSLVNASRYTIILMQFLCNFHCQHCSIIAITTDYQPPRAHYYHLPFGK